MTYGIRTRDIILIVIGVVVILLLGSGIFALGMAGPGGYGMMRGYMSPLSALASMLAVLVIAGLVIIFAIWMLQQSGQDLLGSGSAGSSLEILKARYARGEISREQYEQMRKDLE